MHRIAGSLTLGLGFAVAMLLPQLMLGFAGQAAGMPPEQRSSAAVQARPTGESKSSADQPPARQSEEAQADSLSGPSAEAMQSFRSQMQDLTDRVDGLAERGDALKKTLRTLKMDMAKDGLHLRSDVLEAESRMDHLLAKARQEISAGDAVAADTDLQTAGYAAQFIENFLNR